MPRNSSGVYTLPSGNPVVPGTTIDAAWANDTMEDMANEITNSLSRTGAGGMLAPFRIANGTVTAPGISYLNETNTGLYRSGAGSVWMSVLGVNTVQFSTVGLTIPFGKALTAQGNASVAGTFSVGGHTTLASTLAATGAITASGGVIGNVTGNVTAASGTSSFNDVVISGALDMTAGSSATITGLNAPTNPSDAANKGYVDTQDALKLSLAGGTMSGNIAMGGNLVTGLGAPSAGGDATNKTYVDSQVATRLALTGGTMTGAIAMSNNKVTGLATPTADQDAATKAYVDSVAQGIDAKASCAAATVGNVTLSGTQTIDGYALTAGQRVLVKDQSAAAENGIYVVAAGSWARASDANTWDKLVAAFTFIEHGATNANNGYICTIPVVGTLGITPVTWAQFSGAGQINAGTGMTKNGNTLNVNTASASRIVVGADEIDLATTGVIASTYRSVTVDAYGRVTSGTNPTTLAGYGITDAYTQTQTDTLLAAKLSTTGGTMSGAIEMGGFKVTGLGAPTNAADAATKAYVDTAAALKLNLTGGTMSGALAMSTNKITGLGDPTNPQDAATKNYIDTIFGSTASAAASAATATTQAGIATTQAGIATTQANNAASSANNAATSLFNFRAQYLGPLSSDPTVDGNGNPVTSGDLYYNTTANEMRVYTGATWLSAYLPATGYLALTGGTMTGTINFAAGQTIAGYLTSATAASTYAALGSVNTFTTNQVITANTSADALRITQSGSGNALYIEDVAADATPFVVSSTGVLGIGTTTPDNVTSAGIALVSNDGFFPQVVTRNKTADANASYQVFDKDRAGAIVQNGDVLGNIVFRAFDGVNYDQAAAIMAVVDGAPGLNDTPGALSFLTTADGAASPTERLRIRNNGALGLNGANYGTSGQVLTSQGAGAPPIWGAAGGGGAVAGSNGQVQFNNSGSFGADGGFFWDNTNKRLSINSGSTPTEAVVVGGRIRMGSTGYILADNNGGRQFYISTTGNDTTGDGSIGNPWATLGRALSACAMVMPSTFINYEIILRNGTYSLTSTQYIRGFSGGGRLTIRAETAGSVTVNLSGGAQYELERNQIEVFFNGITFQSLAHPNMFSITDTLRVRFESNCAINQMINSGQPGNFNACITVNTSRLDLYCNLTVVNEASYGAVVNVYDSIYGIGGTFSKSGSRHSNAAVGVIGNSNGAFFGTINNFNIGINMGQNHYDAELFGMALANNLSITNCNIGIKLSNNGVFKNYYIASFSGTTTPVFYANGWYSGTASSEYNLIGYNTSVSSAYRLQVNSQIYATSSTIATSDGRYKKNVASIANGLDIVKALRPVQFDWIPHDIHNFDTEHTTVGFIAQEVKEALAGTDYVDSIIKPHYITREAEEYETVIITPATEEVIDENGNLISLATPPVTEKRVTKPAVTEEFFGIAEGNLIAILTKAIQEQQVMIDQLKADVAALKS